MVSPTAGSRLGSLPREIPIFPLTGALLLPSGQLPLNIFEPRYLAMVDSALSRGRWLGMVQPRDTKAQTVPDQHPLFSTGCLGRITTFSETTDGRYLITITGVSRFEIEAELDMRDGFRRVNADYGAFSCDLESAKLNSDERAALGLALRRYFDDRGRDADWKALDKTPDEVLVASMAMACSFNPAEKQALLEAPDLSARTACLVAMLDMAAHESGVEHGPARH